MASYNGTHNWYNNWIKVQGTTANLATDIFKILLTSSSYVPNSASHTQLSDVTGELTGPGYVRQVLGSVTFTESGGTATFDCDDIQFVATSGTHTAKYWVIYDDTLAGDILVAWGLIDSNGGNVIFTELNLIVDAAGLFTIKKV